MRYRVVTGRDRQKTGSEPRRRPIPVPRPSLPAPAAVGRRAVGLAVRAGVFAPLAWPGTARDVDWSSTPRFGRSPAGWAGAGFHD